MLLILLSLLVFLRIFLLPFLLLLPPSSRAHVHVMGMLRFIPFDINQQSLPTPFILSSVSIPVSKQIAFQIQSRSKRRFSVSNSSLSSVCLFVFLSYTPWTHNTPIHTHAHITHTHARTYARTHTDTHTHTCCWQRVKLVLKCLVINLLLQTIQFRSLTPHLNSRTFNNNLL